MPAQEHVPRSLASSSALAILSVLVLATPLARGGVGHIVEIAALVLACTGAVLGASEVSKLPRPALALAVVVAFIAFQLVPLPSPAHIVSPVAHQVFQTSLAPLARYPSARPLSLDVPATARELGKAVACFATFLTAWTFAGSRQRKRRLLVAFAMSPAVVAGVVLFAALVGVQPIIAPRFPFVNPNHLAAFLDLTAFASLGFAVRARGQARLLWALAFVAVVPVLFSSLSRGGIGAFFVGIGLFALHRSRARGEARASTRTIAGASIVALGAAAFLAMGPVTAKLRQTVSQGEDLKVHLWPAGLRLLRDFPATGIGRGAFSTVFPAYRTDPANVTFTHLENEWLQMPIELGLGAGLLLLGTIAWILVSSFRRNDASEVESGVLAGAVALVAQSLFDFSTEILGIAIPFAVALGLLARGSTLVELGVRRLRVLLCIAFLAGLVSTVLSSRYRDDEGALISSVALDQVADTAASLVALRPADYLPHTLAGARLAAEGQCHEALPWLERAMLLSPGSPDPHLIAARCLVRRGAGIAARLEYRLAYLLGRPQSLEEAAQLWPTFAVLAGVAPDTADGLLALGDTLARLRRPAEARKAYQAGIDEYGDPRAVLPLARAAFASGDQNAAIEIARRRLQEVPTDEVACRHLAEYLLALGRNEEAERALEEGVASTPGSPALLGLLAERSLVARRFAEAHRWADQVKARGAGDTALREGLIARALAGEGRLLEAIRHARSAAAALPDDPNPELDVAQLYLGAGRLADATRAIERAIALAGKDSPAVVRATELRSRIDAERARRDAVLLAPPGDALLPDEPDRDTR